MVFALGEYDFRVTLDKDGDVRLSWVDEGREMSVWVNSTGLVVALHLLGVEMLKPVRVAGADPSDSVRESWRKHARLDPAERSAMAEKGRTAPNRPRVRYVDRKGRTWIMADVPGMVRLVHACGRVSESELRYEAVEKFCGPLVAVAPGEDPAEVRRRVFDDASVCDCADMCAACEELGK